ncbi:hypothetical protein OIU34_27770 [Pararhizobium sp. BT-229]|uniref:hypothetical protein n=1 Tax=Pararhizobium sp. BT-229 TaxID=2986923 RepID=UPI0021F7F1D8|nr:hypothetical protein [Pararhizobium sp. BT-229]MCV9965676.1 hypothetical protein [Pararhizobium sp. BT-229]
MTDVPVRIYTVGPDANLELLLAADVGYFGGSCPVVGDIISLFSDNRHFRVGSRHFLPSKERDRGWAVLCGEEMEAMHTNVAVTWALDSEWATEFDLKIIEDRVRLARKEIKASKKKQP